MAFCKNKIYGIAYCFSLLLLLLLIVFWFGNPQWSRYIYIFQAFYLKYGKNGYIAPPNGFSGKWRTWYANGKIRGECTYKNGQENGTTKTWLINGVLATECEVKNGKYNGYFTSYYPNGIIESRYRFINDVKNGPWLSYYSNGKKQETGQFSKDKQVGIWRGYNKEGKLINKCIYDNNGRLKKGKGIVGWFQEQPIYSDEW